MERKKAALIRGAYWLLVLAVAVLAVRCLYKLLLPFLLGLLIAYLLQPLMGFIARHSRVGKRGVSIAAVIAFYLLVLALLWMLAAAIYAPLRDFADALPGIYRESVVPVVDKVNRLVPRPGSGEERLFDAVGAAAESALSAASQWLTGALTDGLSALPALALAGVFTVVASVLICLDYPRVTAFVMAQIPERLHSTLRGVRDFLARTLSRLVRAYLILMAITFAELSLGLWLLSVEAPLLKALAIALVDLLPVLGSGLILVPWSVWSFLSGDCVLGGGLLVLWVVISAARQLLEPRVIGSQIGLHPLATVTAMYAGMRLAGVGGLILAPVLCMLVRHLHQKGLIKAYREPPA